MPDESCVEVMKISETVDLEEKTIKEETYSKINQSSIELMIDSALLKYDLSK
jgi:hypothetical protein